jgi:hypothetical protein
MKNKLTYLVFLLFITTSWAKQDSLTKIDVRYQLYQEETQQQITYKNDHDLMIPDHLVSMYRPDSR